jgi:bifunctional NMN adenylyltransferase/nudix hydrolase
MSRDVKTGVIVGRFQCHELHDGYLSLFEKVFQDINTHEGDLFVCVIGDTPGQRTSKNPLSFEIRREIVEHDCPYALDFVYKLVDHPSDEEWSANLDKLLEHLPNPILYGSRDSFIPHYKGKFPTKEMECDIDISATQVRAKLKGEIDDWGRIDVAAAGIIHAQENRYPTAYPTVDIAVMNGPTLILLGRKPGMKEWCLIGGFVDPTDKSMEDAAIRELSEEVHGIHTGPMEYVGSFKIDDYRYHGSKDGIITTLFKCDYHGGSFRGADDIEECKFWYLKDIDMNMIQPNHRILIEKLNSL